MAANARQNAYLQMFAAVKTTCDAHNADWAANDLFADGYAAFEAALPRTDAALAQKDAQTEGVTTGKKTLRTALNVRARLLSAALVMYSYATGNDALAGDARTTEDMHTRMAEKSYVGHVKKLRDAALALPANTLVPYGGIDAAFLTALGTDLDAFSTAIGKPRHVVVERKRGDELLDDAIEDILEIFERQMDPAAVLLGLTTAPDFAAEYKSARELTDPGYNQLDLKVTVRNADGVALPGVQAVINPGGIEKLTAAGGGFQIPDLDAGSYTMVLTLAGYQTKNVDFEIVDGQSTTVDATMQTGGANGQ